MSKKKELIGNSITLLNTLGVSEQTIKNEFKNLESPAILNTTLVISKIVDEALINNTVIDI